MRKYQPIWEAIRDNPSNTTKLAADPAMHDRIIKAVIKEKHLDKGWALLMLEDKRKYKLQYSSKNNILAFALIDATPLEYKL